MQKRFIKKQNNIYTPPKLRTGGQERNTKKTLTFCFSFGPTDQLTEQVLESQVRDLKKVQQQMQQELHQQELQR